MFELFGWQFLISLLLSFIFMVIVTIIIDEKTDKEDKKKREQAWHEFMVEYDREYHELKRMIRERREQA